MDSTISTARQNSTISSVELWKTGKWEDNNSGNFYNETYAAMDENNTFSYRVVPVLYLIISMVGLLGNGFAITALWSIISKDKMKCVPDILVFNLAVADFIFMGVLPFRAIQLFMQEGWAFGTVGCKLVSFINYLNGYGSAFFVATMAIDRFFGIVYPIKTRIHRTPRKAIVVCIVTWMLAMLFATPALIWGQVGIDFAEKPLCGWIIPNFVLKQTYYLGVRIGFGFLLPLVVIVICYIVIILKLRRRKSSRLKHSNIDTKQQRITKIILTVISAFFVCWLPRCLLQMMYTIYPGSIPNIQLASDATSFIAYTNSAINPFLYAYIKKDTRDRLKAVLACKTCKRSQ